METCPKMFSVNEEIIKLEMEEPTNEETPPIAKAEVPQVKKDYG